MRGYTPIKDYLRESQVANSRIIVAGVIVLVLMLLLFVRLLYLQTFNHNYYAMLSQENRVNPVPIPPVRGLILDRKGVVLAQNYPVFTLEIVPERVKDMTALLAGLGQLVNLSDRDIKTFRKLVRERPKSESLVLRTHLNEEEAARIALQRLSLDGVELNARLQRHYPQGGLAVHAIGYVGRINEQEAARIDKAAYQGTQHIGKLGVELVHEDLLLGKVGFEEVETDAHGRGVRVLGRTAPAAGRNLYLHLDARMQQIAEESLGRFKGAIIAIDTKTGGVLTFASTPTYDPNLFVNGIDTPTYKLLRDDRNKPLVNRALNGRYAPGSTIKPFMGLMGLETKGFNEHATTNCPGWYSLPGSSHRFRCWKKEGHGPMDLHDAVVQSCDVYFYRLAVASGPERMKEYLSALGFGAKTGIDLDGESTGLVPSPQWKQANNQPWFPGDTVITGIGQGPIVVTPLQLVSAVSVIANHGRRIIPQLLHGIADPVSRAVQFVEPKPPTPLDVADPKHFDAMIRNMTDVVHGRGGTAVRIGFNAPYKIAGKTGTAQVAGIAQGQRYIESQTPEHLRDHALFIAFAPVEDPRIAVAVVVENGGHGSSAAAPIARKLMDYYLLEDAATAGEKAAETPKPAPARANPPKPAAKPAARPAPAPQADPDAAPASAPSSPDPIPPQAAPEQVQPAEQQTTPEPEQPAAPAEPAPAATQPEAE